MSPCATTPSLTPAAALYLCVASDAAASSATLLTMYMRMTTYPNASAIWDGHYALKKEAERMTERLRDAGGLLFFGSAQALAAARAHQEEYA